METTRSPYHSLNNISNRNHSTHIQRTPNTAANTNTQTPGSTKGGNSAYVQYCKSLPKQRRITVERGLAKTLPGIGETRPHNGRINKQNKNKKKIIIIIIKQ
ncbi:hypothetical protein M0802_015442 [Mischocyttarus mexicanus]|nr:hypothetical protein M0802_015442 [Mischocyttarus mexicanus]